MNEPIRVFQLIDGFATSEFSGGASLFGINLARHLDPAQFRPVICSLWRYNTISERRWLAQLREEGIETRMLLGQPHRIEIDLVRASALLWQMIKRIRPHILHSHFERGDLMSLLSKFVHPQHPQIVRTMHADQLWQTRPMVGKLLNLTAYPWLFDHEGAISETTRQVMDARPSARIRQRKATLLYNGLSDQFLAQAAQSRSRQRLDRPLRFAIIGRIEEQKGHRDFLAACAYVAERRPGAEFWIIGRGSLQPELEALAESSGLSGAVTFLGPRSDVLDLLAQIDGFVSASYWEGFPTVILEAMAMGVPVVATDVSGSRELVQPYKTGLLTPVGNPEALGEAMLWIAAHPHEAAGMAEQARQHIHPYTMRRTAAGYARIYHSVLDS